MNIKHSIILSLFILVLSGCVTTRPPHAGHDTIAPAYASSVNWHTLKEGRKTAHAENKPMLVDFAVPEGCQRCEFLQNNVYNRKEITDKINSDFVPIWVDLSKDLTPEEKALGDKFDFKNDCLLLFLDHKGRVIKDPDGKRMCFVEEVPPQVFNDYLDYVREKYIVVQ